MVEQVCGWREVSCPNDILSPEALNKLADACTISLKASDGARHASLSETFRIGPIFDAGWFENAVFSMSGTISASAGVFKPRVYLAVRPPKSHMR